MGETFHEILVSWSTFYFTSGGASAGLLGLLFVAISLTMPYVTDQSLDQLKVFVTPSVVYFVAVMLIASVMLIPTESSTVLAILFILGGIVGLVPTLPQVTRLIAIARHQQDFLLWDWLSEIIMPTVSFLLVIFTGVSFLLERVDIGFALMWVASLMLLLAGIGNTWSLVMWTAEQRRQQLKEKGDD